MSANLINIKGNTYYIKSPVNIGVLPGIVIDTGIDDDMGKKIINCFSDSKLNLKYIINTHSHADHCGGNHFIQSRCEVLTYAPEFDRSIIECPSLEPFYLYSANPLLDMNTKFLQAKPSKVDKTIEPGKMILDDIELDIIPLYGHTPKMIGIATCDNVLFCADSVFSTEIIKKYKLPYHTDIKFSLNTLETLKTLKYDYFIPCHGNMLTDPISTIDANIQSINLTLELILYRCKTAQSREDIVAYLIEEYDISKTISQYYLTSSTVAAYLSYLFNEGMLNVEFENNNLKFKR